MEVIFLIGAIQAVFLAVLIFGKGSKSTADYVLAIWMVFIGLHLLFNYFSVTGIALQHPHLLGVAEFFPQLQGAFLYIYVSILTNENGRFRRSYLFYALPFVFSMVYATIDFYLLGAAEKLNYYLEIAESAPPVYAVLFSLNIYLGPIFVILSFLLLHKHKRNIVDKFSYSEKINLDWLRYVLIGFGFVWAVVLFSELSENIFGIIPAEIGNYLIFISVVMLVFFLGFFGFKQSVIYTNVSIESARAAIEKHAEAEQAKEVEIKVESFREQAERYKRSGLDRSEGEIHLKRLVEYMETEKPYTESRLSLKDLAERLKISTNYLSQIINENLQKNFFDFINEYRVDEVKRSLGEERYKHYSLLGVAYECGFNSKSSFNSIFKKKTGLTPSEFQKSVSA